MLFLPDEDRMLVNVYDGLAVYGKFKDEKKKIKDGVLAMLPNWCQEINKGTTIGELHKWIVTVKDRQRKFLTHFSDFQNDYSKLDDAEKYIDEVCQFI